MLKPAYSEGELRLLEAADLVENSETYCQNAWFNECGTPACALGHYSAAHPEYRYIAYHTGNPAYVRDIRVNGLPTFLTLDFVPNGFLNLLNHFNISYDEFICIFGCSGCNNAQTGKEAAEFIRNFIATRFQARLMAAQETTSP